MEQEIGALLKEARKSRRCSLSDLALKSGIHRTTISRWEANVFQPRLPELIAVLNVLEIPPLGQEKFISLVHAPRGVRHLNHEAFKPPGLEDSLLPSVGDLLKALRCRKKLKLKDAAQSLKVNLSTLSRWERSEMVPSAEDRERLFTLLDAKPEERRVIEARSFHLHIEPRSMMTREEVHQRLVFLTGLSWSSRHELLDLNFLTLEAICWPLTRRDEWAQVALASIFAWHGIGLYWQHRYWEARELGLRALSMTVALPPANTWLWAAGMVTKSSIAGLETKPDQNVKRFLQQFTPMAQHLNVEQLIYDPLFEFAIASGDGEEALRLAQQKFLHSSKMNLDYWSYRTCNWQLAKAYLICGEIDAALSCMPNDEQPNLHQKVEEKLTWVEILLAAQEHALAERRLQEAKALMAEMKVEFSTDQLERQL
jgi:transcriptional regulator with XRE-family HTH domain